MRFFDKQHVLNPALSREMLGRQNISATAKFPAHSRMSTERRIGVTTRVGRMQDRGGLFLILLSCLWIGPATVARASTISYTGNLRADATVTGCGMGCTIGPATPTPTTRNGRLW